MDELELLRQKLDFLKQEINVLEECHCRSEAEEAYKLEFGSYPFPEHKYSTNNMWDFFKRGYDAGAKIHQENAQESQTLDIGQKVAEFFEDTNIPYESANIVETLSSLIAESLVDENGILLSGITLEIIDDLVTKIDSWIPTEQINTSEKTSLYLLVKGYNDALVKIRGSLR